MTQRTVPKVAPRKWPVERGRWLKYGFLSGTFEVFTARRVVNVHDDGTATFEIVGQKHRVDTESVLRAMRDWEKAQLQDG